MSLSLLLSIVSLALALLASAPVLFRIIAPIRYDPGLRILFHAGHPEESSATLQWENFNMDVAEIGVSHDLKYPVAYRIEFELSDTWVLSPGARERDDREE